MSNIRANAGAFAKYLRKCGLGVRYASKLGRVPRLALKWARLEEARVQSQRKYQGPERRVHRVYVTRNTEYHFRGEVCVAVRDRKTGRWLDSHLAMNRRLTGGVRFHQNGAAIPSCAPPEPGEALYFGDDGRELITSMLSSVERPQKKLVQSYPDTAES